MDTNNDGMVTQEEFLEACQKDEDISASMAVFDTSIWHSPVGVRPLPWTWDETPAARRSNVLPFTRTENF